MLGFSKTLALGAAAAAGAIFCAIPAAYAQGPVSNGEIIQTPSHVRRFLNQIGADTPAGPASIPYWIADALNALPGDHGFGDGFIETYEKLGPALDLMDGAPGPQTATMIPAAVRHAEAYAEATERWGSIRTLSDAKRRLSATMKEALGKAGIDLGNVRTFENLQKAGGNNRAVLRFDDQVFRVPADRALAAEELRAFRDIRKLDLQTVPFRSVRVGEEMFVVTGYVDGPSLATVLRDGSLTDEMDSSLHMMFAGRPEMIFEFDPANLRWTGTGWTVVDPF